MMAAETPGTQTVEVETVGPAFAPVLAALHGEAFEAPWSEAAMQSALDQPGALALLAKSKDGPLGFVLIRAGGGEAEVLTIATRPEARRLGVGRALMARALEAAFAGGAARVFLEVATDNAGARGLYGALGFRQVGRRKGYYARGGKTGAVDALVLALDAPGA